MKRALTTMSSASVAFALAIALTACREERTERVAASYSSSTKPTERPPAKREPQKLTVGVEAVPVEEDYELRAASDITEANLKAKLAELELELRL